MSCRIIPRDLPLSSITGAVRSKTDCSVWIDSILPTGRCEKVVQSHHPMNMSVSAMAPILIMGFSDSLLGRDSSNDICRSKCSKISVPDPILCEGFLLATLSFITKKPPWETCYSTSSRLFSFFPMPSSGEQFHNSRRDQRETIKLSGVGGQSRA